VPGLTASPVLAARSSLTSRGERFVRVDVAVVFLELDAIAVVVLGFLGARAGRAVRGVGLPGVPWRLLVLGVRFLDRTLKRSQ